ncbi:hypothetical protein [Promicromonospora sp. NPDC019610]|uniref:hypothetical protein n=1 Tax=Promicromonospora sp. NPDC019610 TaxID=3364405 RepID=UPI0037BD7A36
MGIYFEMYPVDPAVVRRTEEWLDEYTRERDDAFWAWEQDESAPTEDPRSFYLLRYQHHYVNLINPYLEAAYGIDPYSWFAREQVKYGEDEYSEWYFLMSPDEVVTLTATLSKPARDVREELDAFARDNLDMVGTRTPLEGLQTFGTTEPGTVDQFWGLIDALHVELRTFYQRMADNEQAMIGHFSG